MSNCLNLLFAFFIIRIDFIYCYNKFTEEDFDAIRYFGKYLDVECYLFVENDADLTLVKRWRDFSVKEFYFTALKSTFLESLVRNNVLQKRLFERKTLIVSKEQLNLTKVLNDITAPYYLTWMILNDFENVENNFYIPINSKVLFVHPTPDFLTVKQMYHLKPGVNGFEAIQNFTSTSGNESPPSFTIGYTKNDFLNITMDVHSTYNRTYCQKITNLLLTRKIECLQQNMLDLIGRRLNFTPNIIEVVNKENAYRYENGSEGEVFTMLNERKVDLSTITIMIRDKRLDSYDFVWPTFIPKSRMYLKQTRMSSQWDTYLRPLDRLLWWTILIWIVLSGFILQICDQMISNEFKFRWSLFIDVLKSILKALQIFCNQGVSDIPKWFSVRMIYFLILLIVLIFFQAYCGYVASSLTIVIPYFPFHDLKGFFENSNYQIMTLVRGFHQYYFRKIAGEGKRPNYMLNEEDLPHDIKEGVERLCTQDYLVFSEFRENFLDANNVKCKILEIPAPVLHLYVGISLPKNSPYRELAVRELMFLHSVGITHRMRSQLTLHSDFRAKGQFEEYRGVSMAQVFTIFILLGIGIVLSVIAFALEMAIKRHRGYHRINRSQRLPTSKSVTTVATRPVKSVARSCQKIARFLCGSDQKVGKVNTNSI